MAHTHPLGRGLVYAAPFIQHGGATLQDFGPLRLHTDASGVAPTWVGGPAGSMLRFGGASWYALGEQLRGTRLFADGSDLFTVAAIARTTNGSISTVVGRGTTGTDRAFGMFLSATDYRVRCRGQITTLTTGLTSDRRYVLHAASNVGGTIQCYVDGVSVGAAGTLLGADPTGEPVIIGAHNGGANQPFVGDLEAVWIWDRALRAGEVAAHAADPYAMFSAPGRKPWHGTLTWWNQRNRRRAS